MPHVRRWRNKTGVSREEVIMLLFGRGGESMLGNCCFYGAYHFMV